MNVKLYATKVTAVRGLTRHLGAANKLDLDLTQFILQDGMQFGFDADAVDEAVGLKGVSEEDENLILTCGHATCPSCGIHLTNGLSDFEGMVDRHGSDKAAFAHQKHEWMCLACNHEFGTPIVVKGTKASKPSATKGPSGSDRASSAVKGALSVCHAFFNANPTLPRKGAVEGAMALGITLNTARTQYQKWFAAQKAQGAK